MGPYRNQKLGSISKKVQDSLDLLHATEIEQDLFKFTSMCTHTLKTSKAFIPERFAHKIAVLNRAADDYICINDYAKEFLMEHYMYCIHAINTRIKFDTPLRNKPTDIPLAYYRLFIRYTDKAYSNLEDKKLLNIYYQIAQLCYRISIFLNLMVGQWGVIIGQPMAYLQCIFSDYFADFISTYRKYIIRYHISPDTRDVNHELYKEAGEFQFQVPIQVEECISYDMILSEEYLIFWNNSYRIEDFFVTQTLPCDASPHEETFKNALLRVLQKGKARDKLEIDKLTMFSHIKNSSSFIPEEGPPGKDTTSLKNNTRKNINKLVDLQAPKRRDFVFKRCIVPKVPGDSRDCFIRTLDTHLAISFYEHLIYQIAENHPGFTLVNQEKFEDRINKFIHNHKGEYFICIDLKKAGLTINHQLIKWTCEILQQVFGFNFTYLYEGIHNARVYVDGEPYSLKRGKGLGMCNNLYTLVYMTVVETLELESLHCGDDVVIASGGTKIGREGSLTIARNIQKVYESYGLELSKKKTIVSKSFIFEEELYDPTQQNKFYYDKLQKDVLSIMDIIFYRTPEEQKEYMAGLTQLTNFKPEYLQIIVRELVDNQLIESEFSQYSIDQEELILPNWLGGFGLQKRDSPLDYSLVNAENASTYWKNIIWNLIMYKDLYISSNEKYEKNKVSLIYEDICNTKITWIGDPDAYEYLYKTYSYEGMISQIEKSLNLISNRKRLEQSRLRTLLKVAENRKDLSEKVSRFSIEHSSCYDLLIEIINTSVYYKPQRDFALCKTFIANSGPDEPDVITGYREYFDTSYFKNHRISVMSYLQKLGKITSSIDLGCWPNPAFVGPFEKHKYFSYKSTILKDISVIEPLVDILKYQILSFNCQPEMAIEEYLIREKTRVLKIVGPRDLQLIKDYMALEEESEKPILHIKNMLLTDMPPAFQEDIRFLLGTYMDRVCKLIIQDLLDYYKNYGAKGFQRCLYEKRSYWAAANEVLAVKYYNHELFSNIKDIDILEEFNLQENLQLGDLFTDELIDDIDINSQLEEDYIDSQDTGFGALFALQQAQQPDSISNLSDNTEDEDLNNSLYGDYFDQESIFLDTLKDQDEADNRPGATQMEPLGSIETSGQGIESLPWDLFD